MSSLRIISLIIAMLLCQGATFVVDPTKNAVWHNEKGLFFMDLKHYYAAVNEFQLAIMLNPDSEVSATFYNNLAQACHILGDTHCAEESLRKAMDLKPFYLEYYRNLVDIHKQTKTLGDLAIEKTNLISGDQDNPQALLLLGLIHRELDNKALAAGYLRRFVLLAPDLSVSAQLKEMIKELEE